MWHQNSHLRHSHLPRLYKNILKQHSGKVIIKMFLKQKQKKNVDRKKNRFFFERKNSFFFPSIDHLQSFFD